MADILYLPAASKYIKKVKDVYLKQLFRTTIEQIAEGSLEGKAKTGDLSGIFGYDIYYNGVNYEIAYTIITVNGHTVVVILAGPRENFYDSLKRYIKTL